MMTKAKKELAIALTLASMMEMMMETMTRMMEVMTIMMKVMTMMTMMMEAMTMFPGDCRNVGKGSSTLMISTPTHFAPTSVKFQN